MSCVIDDLEGSVRKLATIVFHASDINLTAWKQQSLTGWQIYKFKSSPFVTQACILKFEIKIYRAKCFSRLATANVRNDLT